MLEFVFGSSKKDGEVKIFFVNEKKKIKDGLSAEEAKILKNAMTLSDFKGSKDEMIETFSLSGKIMVFGVNEETKWQQLGANIYHKIAKNKNAVIFSQTPEQAYQVAFGMDLASYRFDKYKTSLKKEDLPVLNKVNFQSGDKKGYEKFAILADGVKFAKDLVNEPANILTPDNYASVLKKLEKIGLKVEVLGKKEIEKSKMGLLLGVSQGSKNEPKVAILKWQGSKKKGFDTALVGKGITFDSGGINIKPSNGMEEMKGDMAGSAAVVSALKTIASQKLPVNVVGAVALVENMPSGEAIRPSDILVSMSGQTVEIGNTDAEGRLVLADIMTYVQEKFKVKRMVDIATLTGSSQNALGGKYSSIMGNDEGLIKELIACGINTDEPLWQMPLTDEHEKMLKSNIADMNNIAKGGAGMSTAAAFLRKFVKKDVKWAHIDMAGFEFKDGQLGKSKGAIGFGVRLFVDWML